MNTYSGNSHDQVFVEEDMQKEIAKMHKLLATGSAAHIQKHFYNQPKFTSH